jgi:multidrug efflux system outer membrane protein
MWGSGSGATRVAAGAAACGLFVAVPSCRIPDLRLADPGPVMPGDYVVPGGTAPPALAAVVGGCAAGVVLEPDNSARLGIDQFFNDPTLTGLIAQALAGNQELKILEQDIQVASNEIMSRRGAYLPFLGFRGNAGVERPSDFTPIGQAERQLEYFPGKHFPDPRPNFLLSTNVFWQLDIWRELRNARDAAIERYQAAVERRNFFVTRMVAEIADSYYELMALDKRLEILNQTIDLMEQSQRVAEALKASGRGTELGVQRFLAEVRRNQSEKLIVAQHIVEVENRINFLLGRYPQPVVRSAGDYIDLSLHALSAGVPAQLLQYRPDVRQAERELVAAGLDIKVARARFFPRLDLFAGIGYEAFSPKYLFMTPESLIYNAAGEMTAPLVNKMAIRADYLSANARQLEAVYNYQRVVLNAYTEVVNRLSKVQNYRKSIALKRQQLDALHVSVDLASQLFQRARADYVDVLFAQRDQRDAATVLIETKQQELSAVVNAYQALGGGYLMSGAAPALPPAGGQPAPPQPLDAPRPAPAADPMPVPQGATK